MTVVFELQKWQFLGVVNSCNPSFGKLKQKDYAFQASLCYKNETWTAKQKTKMC